MGINSDIYGILVTATELIVNPWDESTGIQSQFETAKEVQSVDKISIK